MTRTRRDRCPEHAHGHRYAPTPLGGYHADGSARLWYCDCGASIRFQPWPPVTIGRAR